MYAPGFRSRSITDLALTHLQDSYIVLKCKSIQKMRCLVFHLLMSHNFECTLTSLSETVLQVRYDLQALLIKL